MPELVPIAPRLAEIYSLSGYRDEWEAMTAGDVEAIRRANLRELRFCTQLRGSHPAQPKRYTQITRTITFIVMGEVTPEGIVIEP